MSYQQEIIKKAVEELKNKNLAPIVRYYDGFIILAQNEDDYRTKVTKINRGDVNGFYTLKKALKLK